MADVLVSIGGTEYTVACADGEERFLKNAAELLNTEAQALMEHIGRVPEDRILLMAGLMLADKTASIQEKLRLAEDKLKAAERRAAELAAEREAEATLPEGLVEKLNELADQAERIAGP